MKKIIFFFVEACKMLNDIIKQIVSDTYEKYGKNTLFREYDYTTRIYDRLVFMYRVQSAINFPYLYDIQLHFFDKIKKDSNMCSRLFKSCIYCKEKNCHYQMNCCGKYVHLMCGIQNNFACCELKKTLCLQVPNECCVCLETCATETECGHTLCNKCLIEMSKRKGLVSCPMCRSVIIDQYDRGMVDDLVNVFLNEKEILVRVTYV